MSRKVHELVASRPVRETRIRRIAIGAAIAVLAILAIASIATAQTNVTTEHLADPLAVSTNGLALHDTDGENNTFAACAGFEDFDSWKVYVSNDQGNDWNEHEFFNGSVGFSLREDMVERCNVGVSPSGATVVAVMPNPDGGPSAAVAVSTDAGETFELDTETFNDSTTDWFLNRAEIEVRNETAWGIMFPRDDDKDGSANWTVNWTNDQGQTYTGNVIRVNEDPTTNGAGPSEALCSGPERIYAFIFVNGGENEVDVFRSDDDGQSFSKVNTIFDGQSDSDPNHPSQCFVPRDNRLHVWYGFQNTFENHAKIKRSKNEGQDFQNRDTIGQDFDGNKGQLWLDGNSTKNVSYAFVDQNGNVWKNTTSGGSSWTSLQTRLSSRSPDGDSQDEFADGILLFPRSNRFHGIVDNNESRLDFYREKPPPPGASRAVTVFGSAAAVRTNWAGSNPEIFVRDINGDDQVARFDQQFNEEKRRNVCDATFEDTDDAGIWDFFFGDEVKLRDTSRVDGLDVNRNTTTNVVHACDIKVIKDLEPDQEGGGFVLRNRDLGFLDYNFTGTDEPPIEISSFETTSTAFGIPGDTPQGVPNDRGVGEWGYIIDNDEIQLSPNLFEIVKDTLPAWENMTGVAVDKKIDTDTRLACVSSDTNGTACFNRRGGEVARNESIDAEDIQVFQQDVFLIETDGNITRRSVDASADDFPEEARSDQGALDIYVSRDGTLVIGCFDQRIEIYDSTTLEQIVASTDFTSGMRDCFIGPNNNFAYAVNADTLFQIPISDFVGSASQDDVIIGQELPEQNLDTSSTGDEDTTDDTTATDDVTKSEVTDTTAIATSLGISLESANILMSVLTTAIFAIGMTIGVGTTVGRGEIWAGAVGGFAGAGVATAYGWMQDWLLFLFVLILAVVLAFKVRGG